MTDPIRSWAILFRAGALVGATFFAALCGARAFGQTAPADPPPASTVERPRLERGATPIVRPSAAIGGASVIRPGAYLTYDAFPFSPFFGYPAVNLGFPQPLGHQIISYGPSGYTYRPVTDLGTYYDRALAALRAANYRQVLVELDPVLSEMPEDGDTWMVRAQALFALGNYGKAASSLHTALRLLPNSEWGRPVVRVRDYFASEAEFASRLRALETYVRDHPREGAGHFLLGYYYGYRGNTSLAERELRTALRLVTGDEELANALLAPLQAAPVVPVEGKPRPGLDENDGPREF